jgi:sugar phosphate isomerase/epimerase
MMFSCASTLLRQAGAEDFREAADSAASLGYDGLHLESVPGGLIDAASFSFKTSGELVHIARGHELDIHCLSGDGWSGAEPDDPALGLKRLVCIAHALACPLVTVVPPALVTVEEFEARYEHAIAAMQEAVELASELDICLALEPAADSLAVNADEAVDFVDDVDRKNLGIVYNPGYLAMTGGESPITAVELLKDYLLLVRLRGARERAVSSGDFDIVLRELVAAQYSQYVADMTECGQDTVPAQAMELLRSNIAHLRGIVPAREREREREREG